jgi:hypothetical protein
MKNEIFSIIVVALICCTIIGSASVTTHITNTKDDTLLFNSLNIGDDVPVWEVGTIWTFEIDNIDLSFSETEGRSIDLNINTGYFILEVAADMGSTYRTDLSIEGDVTFDINFDMGIEGKEPLIISGNLFDSDISGYVYFEKSTLLIDKLDVTFNGKIKVNMVSPFDLSFLANLPISFDLNLVLDFDQNFVLIDFPIETGNTWGISQCNVTIDGEISSIWLRLLKFINTIASLFGMGFLPPEIASLLPVIDISDLFESLEMEPVIQIPDQEDVFECKDITTTTVEAGTYQTYPISIQDDLGIMYYAPELGMIAKISGNFKEIFPFFQDISMELVEVS